MVPVFPRGSSVHILGRVKVIKPMAWGKASMDYMVTVQDALESGYSFVSIHEDLMPMALAVGMVLDVRGITDVDNVGPFDLGTFIRANEVTVREAKGPDELSDEESRLLDDLGL
jgi:hypothetical protein